MTKTIHDQRYICLIEKLKHRRMQLQLRQTDLAKRLNVSRSWIGKIECRELKLDVLQFTRVCHALELDPAECLRHINKEAA
jgi:transcriptional regulator with XRE-family HTH domain